MESEPAQPAERARRTGCRTAARPPPSGGRSWPSCPCRRSGTASSASPAAGARCCGRRSGPAASPPARAAGTARRRGRCDRGEVADHEHLGVSGHAEVGADDDLAARGLGQPERGRERVGLHARGPDARCGSGSPCRRRARTRSAATDGDRRAEPHLDAALRAARPSLPPATRAEKAPSRWSVISTRTTRARPTSRCLKSFAQHHGEQLGQRAAELDAGGPAAGDHERQRAVVDARRIGVGLLEAGAAPCCGCWLASASVLSGMACSATPGTPKSLLTAPAARTR